MELRFYSVQFICITTGRIMNLIVCYFWSFWSRLLHFLLPLFYFLWDLKHFCSNRTYATWGWKIIVNSIISQALSLPAFKMAKKVFDYRLIRIMINYILQTFQSRTRRFFQASVDGISFQTRSIDNALEIASQRKTNFDRIIDSVT